jgi:hypothetical protein
MSKSVYDQLKDWHELMQQGIISEVEFLEKKQVLLGIKPQKKEQPISLTQEAVRTEEEQAQIDGEYELLFKKSWFQKNKIVLIGLLIVICIASIWFLIQQQSASLPNHLQKTDSAYYLTKADNSNPVYFYSSPDPSTKKLSYFSSNEIVFITNIENGFGYTEFTNDKGQTSKGWLVMQDLILTDPPSTTKAFTITKAIVKKAFLQYLPDISDGRKLNAYFKTEDGTGFKIVIGDLNGDGLNDAVVDYSLNPDSENNEGGHAINEIPGLVGFINTGKTLIITDHSASFGGNFGSRNDLKKINNGVIILEGREYSENDPRCCPSLKTTTELVLRDGKLTKLN